MSGELFAPPGLTPWIMRRCDRATGEEAVDAFQSLTAALVEIVRSEEMIRRSVQPELWVDPAAEREAAATAPLEYRGEKFLYLLELQAR
jgi:hypothetical protein